MCHFGLARVVATFWFLSKRRLSGAFAQLVSPDKFGS